MKKFMIIAAAAATLLAAGCSKNEIVQNVTDQATPVSFGVYAGKAVTKTAPVSAAYYGNITTTELKLATAGFGVFGYYTGNDNYASSTAANFMYNEKVTWNSTVWEYSPVKYWPNEHGASAVSSDEDKLTFLCYAPYVANLVINGGTNSTVSDGAGTPAAATQGITAMTGNTMAEDAKITFSVPSSKDEQIDLLFGRLKTSSVNVDGDSEPAVAPAAPGYSAIENLTKEKTGGKVDIIFRHALAKAQIDICDVIDDIPANAPTSVNPTTTKVVVKNLNILGVDSEGNRFGTAGVLNLYTGAWSSVTGTASFAITPLPACISVASAPTSWASLTSIEGVLEDGLTAAGYAAAPGKFNIMFVPGGKIKGVEIVYYVVTQDAKLDGGVSVVENHISKDFATPITTAAGTQYNINIQLGLTSVKLQADVQDWTTEDHTIDLPANVS